jgi:hypothetical protein
MEKNTEGRLAITRVELHPKITWSGRKKPTAEELDKMHQGAHEQCFIANSVKTEGNRSYRSNTWPSRLLQPGSPIPATEIRFIRGIHG